MGWLGHDPVVAAKEKLIKNKNFSLYVSCYDSDMYVLKTIFLSFCFFTWGSERFVQSCSHPLLCIAEGRKAFLPGGLNEDRCRLNSVTNAGECKGINFSLQNKWITVFFLKNFFQCLSCTEKECTTDKRMLQNCHIFPHQTGTTIIHIHHQSLIIHHQSLIICLCTQASSV